MILISICNQEGRAKEIGYFHQFHATHTFTVSHCMYYFVNSALAPYFLLRAVCSEWLLPSPAHTALDIYSKESFVAPLFLIP